MSDKSSARQSAWPLMLSLLAAVLLAATIGHVLMRMPIGFGDNFDEIADTYGRLSAICLPMNLLNLAPIFDPLRSLGAT